ncbi:MAG: hypothetical protein JST83_15480 [Bacteroidetes bacterium]|nr:hypothetical protein [Bacteroidota bacterium]
MENTNNKIRAGIAVLGIAMVVLSYSPVVSLPFAAIANVFWFLKTITLILIVRDGTILSARPFNYILGLCAIVAGVSGLLMIMHWPGGKLFYAAIAGAGLTYFVRFVLKEHKSVLDWLKVAYVGSVVVASALRLAHILSGDMLKLVTDVAFVAMVAGYIYMLMQEPGDKAISKEA